MLYVSHLARDAFCKAQRKMGGGASANRKFHYETLGDQDPAAAQASPLAWACYMRPDGAPDANGADRACACNTGPSNCGEVKSG